MRLTGILAASFSLAASTAVDDPVNHEIDESQIFRGSSAEPPGDVFLVKRDRTHQLAGISLPEPPGLGHSLAARQQQQCPYPVMCSPRSCCPAGYKCCNAGAPPLCCPSTSACRLDVSNCCPDTAVTCGGKFCAEQGSVCCGQSICPAGTECNTNGGSVSCCRPGELKCLGTCCPAGSQCSPQAGYCRRLVLTRSTTTTEVSTTRTRVIESTETSTRTTVVSSRVTSTTKTTETASSCSANGRARRGDEHEPALQRRQNLRPNCVYECVNGRRLPVVEVPNVPGQTDQLFLSMCSGILGTAGGGRSGGGDGRNFDVLTYRGADGKRQRRSQARCTGYCAQQKAVFGDPASLQCDEYPPAMAGEGGKGAFRVCIPNAQNSGAQGRLFRRFVSDCAPAKGQPFVVRMKGGCNVRNDKREVIHAAAAATAAAAAASATTFNASSSVLYAWDDSMRYMYVPLPDLRAGQHYRVDVRFRGAVRGVRVTDSDGEDYYVSGGGDASDGHVVEFEVPGADGEEGEDDAVPAGLFLDVDEAVEVSYAGEATANGTQTGQESRAAGFPAISAGSWWLWLAVLGIAVV